MQEARICSRLKSIKYKALYDNGLFPSFPQLLFAKKLSFYKTRKPSHGIVIVSICKHNIQYSSDNSSLFFKH